MVTQLPISAILSTAIITKDAAEVKVNASSKGAERFLRPLHTLSPSLFPTIVVTSGPSRTLLSMSLGLVLVFLPAEAIPRHDVIMSEISLCCLRFLPLTLISAAQVRMKETSILCKHSSQRHSTQCRTKKFSLHLLRHHHISIIFNGQRP